MRTVSEGTQFETARPEKKADEVREAAGSDESFRKGFEKRLCKKAQWKLP
jgi:hypothetical protein